MGCSTLACRWSSFFITCRKGGASARLHCGRCSFHCGSWSVWPSLSFCTSTTGLYQHPTPLLPLLASQEGLASSQDGIAEDNLWQRVQLLQRLLDLSIAEENYSQAKQVHDQLTGLKAQLPEAEQLLLLKVRSLATGSVSEKLEMIAELGEMGDYRVVPMLVNGLLDSNSQIASETEKAMWKIFMCSGREDVDRLLEEGLGLMLSSNLSRAKDVFTKVIESAPSFAEGWNKRATVNYLMQEYQASIIDCERTLELNPYHFGALSGMGLCYAALNDSESALLWFEKAYSLHPGLGQINRFIKMLKQKLSEPNRENETNKDNPWKDS
eukprot:c23663_g1_i1 orf=61-1035(+)